MRLQFLGLLLAVLPACRPSRSARTVDASPPAVADSSRPLQQASSRYYDLSVPDCRARRIVNVRFRLVALRGAGPNYVVVQQTEDVTTRDCAEGAEGTVSVEVWDERQPQHSVTKFANEGSEGAIDITDDYYQAAQFAPLYRTTYHGCCGSLDLYRYTNLIHGTPAFAATTPLTFFYGNGTIRYVAVMTQQPLPPIPQSLWSDRTAAVVQYGTGDGTPEFRRIEGDSGVTYRLETVDLLGPHRSSTDSMVVIAGRCCNPADTAAITGVSVIFRLFPQDDVPSIEATIPIRADHLAPPIVRRIALH